MAKKKKIKFHRFQSRINFLNSVKDNILIKENWILDWKLQRARFWFYKERNIQNKVQLLIKEISLIVVLGQYLLEYIAIK